MAAGRARRAGPLPLEDAGRAARAELDWERSHPGLVDEFRNGSYRKVSAAT